MNIHKTEEELRAIGSSMIEELTNLFGERVAFVDKDDNYLTGLVVEVNFITKDIKIEMDNKTVFIKPEQIIGVVANDYQDRFR